MAPFSQQVWWQTVKALAVSIKLNGFNPPYRRTVLSFMTNFVMSNKNSFHKLILNPQSKPIMQLVL